MSANAEIIAELRRVLNERDEALGKLEAICDRHVECWPREYYQSAVHERDEARATIEQIRRVFGNALAFDDARGDIVKMAEIAYRGACDGDKAVGELRGMTRQRDEWRDKFLALNQTAGELCNACGWAFKIPGESCRCEVIKERDEARAEVERQRELKDYLRTWLSSEELEGLRVKAADHPLLWEEIHHLKAEVERLREMAHDFEAMREDRDEARAEVERLKREVSDAQIALRAQEHRDQWLMAQSVGYGFYKRGAEAMREACAVALMADGLVLSRERAAKVVRAQPIPEEP